MSYIPTEEEMVKVCQENAELLNSWELQFIDDINFKLNKGWDLSNKQEDKLEQIYGKVMKEVESDELANLPK